MDFVAVVSWMPLELIPFGSLVECHAKGQSRIHLFGKEVSPGLFLGYVLYVGRIWKGDILIADLEELETMDASEIHSKRLNAKEVILPKQGEFTFPVADGRIKTPGEDQELRTSTSIRQRPIRGESNNDFSWRITRVSSTTSWFTSGCRWSDTWFLVHVGKFHIPPSRWTSSQAVVAERRIIPLIHWNTLTYPENYSYEFGCQAGEAHWWSLEHRCVSRLVWSLERFHTIYSIGRKTSWRTYVVRGEINKKTIYIQARSFMVRTLEINGKARQAEGEVKMVWWKAPSGKRTKIARDQFHRPRGYGI